MACMISIISSSFPSIFTQSNIELQSFFLNSCCMFYSPKLKKKTFKHAYGTSVLYIMLWFVCFFRVTDPLQFTTFALTSHQRQSNSISKQKPKLIITEDLGSRLHHQDTFLQATWTRATHLTPTIHSLNNRTRSELL